MIFQRLPLDLPAHLRGYVAGRVHAYFCNSLIINTISKQGVNASRQGNLGTLTQRSWVTLKYFLRKLDNQTIKHYLAENYHENEILP